MIKCSKCKYSTLRNFNLERHHFNKHNKKESKNINVENNSIFFENNSENFVNNSNIFENNSEIDLNNTLINKKFNCTKCNKSYNTIKFLNSHETKCIGINILTCPKCMKTFKHQQSKSKHMKANNCKANSIVNYNNPNITNNNNITNITNNNITNNIIIINSYGNERVDYLTINKILEICKKTPCSSIIPNYIEAKHFNKDFPENNNIKYENNTCFKFINNQWKNININLLSDELILKSSNEINDKINKNKKEFQDYYKNEEILEYVQKHFNYLDLSINIKLYKEIKTKIKDLIKTPMLLL